MNAIARNAENHDLVLVEGVKSRNAKLLTAGYRRLANVRSLNLTLQADIINSRFYPHWRNSDIAVEEFDQHFQNVGLRTKLLLFAINLLLPLFVRSRGQFIRLNESINDNDFRTLEAIRDNLVFGETLSRILMEHRDKALHAHVGNAVSEGHERIAIVWGAAHVPQLAKHLQTSLGYSVVSTKWHTDVSPQT